MKSKLLEKAIPCALAVFNRQFSKNVELIIPINLNQIKGDNHVFYQMIPITRKEADEVGEKVILATLDFPGKAADNAEPLYGSYAYVNRPYNSDYSTICADFDSDDESLKRLFDILLDHEPSKAEAVIKSSEKLDEFSDSFDFEAEKRYRSLKYETEARENVKFFEQKYHSEVQHSNDDGQSTSYHSSSDYHSDSCDVNSDTCDFDSE